jgi:O-antigen ligase
MPFYVVLPNPYFDELAFWRPLLALLFLKWFFWDGGFRDFRRYFLVWDKLLFWLFLIFTLTSLLFARFKIPAVMFLAFLLNAYLVYLLTLNLARARKQLFELAKAIAWALAIIITLGFVQLFVTFATDLDTFWVYWASNISRVFYGEYFMKVALFSNSWFSFSGGRELRMFSIMPDSQSFAYLTVFGIGIGTALTCQVASKWRSWLWSGIRSAGLALILSGTRAVWVGMFLPLLTIVFARIKNFQSASAKKYLWPFAIIIFLFAVSPLINKGLQYLRVGGKFQENFLKRAESIYDLREASNVGRLLIWRDSLAFATTHPWGVGPKNFLVSLTSNTSNFEQASGELNERYNLPQIYVSAHSLYLQLLVEGGVAGLVVFIYFGFLVFKEIFNFLRVHKNEFNFLIALVFQSGLVFLWLFSAAVFDVTLFNDKVILLFFLNLAIAGIVIKDYLKLLAEKDGQ